MTRTARALLALAVAALLVAACGGGADEPRKTAETAGFATYEVKSAGFSIDVPEDWETASVDKVFNEEAMDKFGEENPELAPFMDAVGQPNSPVKLFAFDPDVEAGLVTNLNVIVEDLPGALSREEYFDANVRQIEEIINPPSLTDERVQLPAGEALHLAYEGDFSGRTVSIEQFALFSDGQGFILTYTTAPDRVDEYAADFERSARSFRIG
jgi:hypothetical protein